MQDKDTLYARWLNGDIDEDELKVLREDGALQELEAIVKATEELSLPKYDAEVGYEKFKKKHAKKTTKATTFNLRRVISIAASFLLLAFLTWTFFSSNKEQTIVAQNGFTKKVDLLDRSSVVINDGSSVTYDPKNWEKERKVDLKGEAFFQVQKGNPFVGSYKRKSLCKSETHKMTLLNLQKQ